MYCWWGMEFNADSITGTSTALRLEFQPGLPPPALLIQMVGLGLLLGGGPTRRGAARGKYLRRRGGAILLPLRRPLFQHPPPCKYTPRQPAERAFEQPGSADQEQPTRMPDAHGP
jgi:hypothetical protein